MVIYLTTNLINGKKYIGKDARNQPYYLGSGKYLKKAIQKYGKENFKKEILQECSTLEELNEAELKWLKKLNCKSSSIYYNATDTLTPSSHGRKLSEEHKKKISESNKGKKLSDEHKKKLSKIRTGVKRGPLNREIKDKISSSLIGRKKSIQSKLKMSEKKRNIPQLHNRVRLLQIDPVTLKVLKVYDKLTEINDYGFNARSLSNNFKKGIAFYKGYIWRREK